MRYLACALLVSLLFSTFLLIGGSGAATCSDTDVTSEFPDGKNYATTGTVDSADHSPVTDSCRRIITSGGSMTSLKITSCDAEDPECYLQEFYCLYSGNLGWEEVPCPNGCDSGACLEEETCVPNCAGRDCGSDGCGGSCGKCTPPATCSQEGLCTEEQFSAGYSCVFDDPRDTEGNRILVSKHYYGTNYTLYAGRYCEKVKECTGFKDVVVKNDAVKACRCDDFWGCPYGGYGHGGTASPSCVEDVSLNSLWERVGSVTCTGCPETACNCTPDCTGKECGSDGCGGSCGSCKGINEHCYNGLCACDTGWDDCYASVPGCETNIHGNDTLNCGGCGVKCGENQECVSGKCKDTTECGNGACEGGEDCRTCPADCGECECEDDFFCLVLTEGESVTVTVGGEDYEILMYRISAAPDRSILSINGFYSSFLEGECIGIGVNHIHMKEVHPGTDSFVRMIFILPERLEALEPYEISIGGEDYNITLIGVSEDARTGLIDINGEMFDIDVKDDSMRLIQKGDLVLYAQWLKLIEHPEPTAILGALIMPGYVIDGLCAGRCGGYIRSGCGLTVSCHSRCGTHSNCEYGRCVCEDGWSDCDASVEGCETDIMTDNANCGSCGASCSETCINGWCRAQVKASIATMKDLYAVGEPIRLTDPPDTDALKYPVITGFAVQETAARTFEDVPDLSDSRVERLADLRSAKKRAERLYSESSLEYESIRIEGLNLINPFAYIGKYFAGLRVEAGKSNLNDKSEEFRSALSRYDVPEHVVEELDQIDEKAETWEANFNPKYVKNDSYKASLLGVKAESGMAAQEVSPPSGGGGISSVPSELPDFFDWRDYHELDYITPVKDQESCGSCWAFASVAGLEATAGAYFNNPEMELNLSEQDLVSCFHGYGCGGASLEQIEDLVSNYMVFTGVAQESDFPYTATNSNCSDKDPDWEDGAWKTSGHMSVDLGNIEEIKKSLIDKGPIITGMAVYSDFFSYDEGIYYHTTGGLAGYHAVLIVGYGIYDGATYWIVKNSWGEEWGEDGYFRIFARDSMIDEFFLYALEAPIDPGSSEARRCEDTDNDGYCNWGSGDKPVLGCPPCDDDYMDCDDSDATIYQGCGISEDVTGRLFVTSSPGGASVYVKDQYKEEYIYRGKTPVNFTLNSGDREIKLLKEDYIDYFETVTVLEDSPNYVEVTLKIAPKLIYPLNNDILRAGDIVEITGNIPSDGLDHFTLEYENIKTDQRSSEGITLTGGGYTPVTEGVIATWDTSSLEGYYDLHLTVHFTGGQVNSTTKSVSSLYIDPTLKEGWPVKLYYDFVNETLLHSTHEYFVVMPRALPGEEISGEVKLVAREEMQEMLSAEAGSGSFGASSYYIWRGFIEPILADIDKDNHKEIVLYTGGHPPKVSVYNSDGSLRWERDVGVDDVAGGNVHPPAVGDVDNDGFDDIVVCDPKFSDYYYGGHSDVYAFDKDGNVLWVVEVSKDYHPSVIIADLDLDGIKDVIVKGSSAEPEVMSVISGGKLIAQWDLEDAKFGSMHVSAPSVGNFDDDPELEIVVATQAENAGGGYWANGTHFYNNTGAVYVYNMDGSVVEGWPVHTDGFSITSSPAVADIDADGSAEIIVGLMYVGTFPNPDVGGLIALDNDGTPLWTAQKGWNFVTSPSVGDLDGDGYLEIAASKLGSVSYIFNHDGSQAAEIETTWNEYYSTIMGDVTGDGVPEVLASEGNGFYPNISYHGGIHAWDAGGAEIEGFPKVTESDAQGPAAVADIDNDGSVDIVASSDWDIDIAGLRYKYRGSIYVWETGSTYHESAMPWPIYHHDSGLTGMYGEIPRPQSKITNIGTSDVTGRLRMTLQRKVPLGGWVKDVWMDVQVVTDKKVTVPAEGLIKLDEGEGYGWNLNEVKADTPGDYRAYVSFEYAGKKAEASWDFEVSTGYSCVFDDPRDLTEKNRILISTYIYDGNYTQYAGTYCEKVKGCTGFKDVEVKNDSVKACRCDDHWGCRGESCVPDVSTDRYWERVGSVTCTGCPDELCSSACVPDCEGKDCGSDGCGGSCGTCSSGELCQNGACICIPNCTGKECGSDGCGGSCGTCTPPATCSQEGVCSEEGSSAGISCVFDDPRDTEGNRILVSKHYYGTNYTLYAGTYCEKVKGCTGFKDVEVKNDSVKACRCDDFWGCPYGGYGHGGTAGPSCVEDVSLHSLWERVGSVTCTGCPADLDDCTPPP